MAKEKLMETKLRKEIYQTNPLINARKGMSIMGLRIFALGLSGVNPHISEKDKYYDEEFEVIYIKPKKLVEIFGNPKYLNELDKTCEKLFNVTIKLNDEDDGWELYHVFRMMKYKKKEGLYLQFDDKMKPFILNLFQSGGYTKIALSQLFPLSSTYAWRLVELMLQFKGTKKKLITRTISIENLKFLLDVPSDAYKGQMGNFKKNVLEKPINEINSKTNYHISYETIKDKNRVSAFKILMDISKADILEQVEEYELHLMSEAEPRAIKKLNDIGYSRNAAKSIYDCCDGDEDCLKRISYALDLVKKYERKGKSVNKLALIRKAIQENWFKAEEDKKKPSIANILAAWEDLNELYFDDNVEYSGKEKPITISDHIRCIMYDIKRGNWSTTSKNLLSGYNLTVRRFIEIYATKYLNAK